MPRPLSITARQAIFAAQTGEVFLILCTLSHPSLAEPIRVVQNTQDITHQGQTFQRFPFEVTLPAENDEAPPAARISIDNADRTIMQAVRSLTQPAMTVELKVVLASSPDVVEVGPFEFKLRDVVGDAGVVSGSLMYEDLLRQQYPGDDFTPGTTPGLF